ncbi:hypothetical protein H4R23_002122, partial [Coemansia sp. Cherry 401B]
LPAAAGAAARACAQRQPVRGDAAPAQRRHWRALDGLRQLGHWRPHHRALRHRHRQSVPVKAPAQLVVLQPPEPRVVAGHSNQAQARSLEKHLGGLAPNNHL